MPFGFKALLFKSLLINLLISFIKIIGLILNTLYSIVTSILILLKSVVLVLEKNLAIKMSIYIVLLFIKRFLINLLRSSKWGSAFTTFIFLFHFNKI